MNTTLYQKCIEENRLYLLAEWDMDKNAPLTPWTVTPGSHKKIWWRCDKGHRWQTAVATRWTGHGCPYCGRQKLLPGFNDLATVNPQLAARWHPEKNGALTPSQVSPFSQKRVWWRCDRGHEWQASVAALSGGSGCPICSGRKVVPGLNDLQTLFPDIAGEWHPTKNGSLTPDAVRPHSNRQVWWQCGKGHQWKAVINTRVRSAAGCPVCANRTVLPGVNDLATTNPALAREWHPTRNGALTPRQVVAGSSERVWWQCDKGHQWRARIDARNRGGCGCPACAGKVVISGENDLASFAPQIAAQWHPTRNGALTPDQVRPMSNRSVWWQCEQGHAWQAGVSARVRDGSGCPYCANRAVLPGFNDFATVEPIIAAQWADDLNGNLTPEMVTFGSRKRVWWRCQDGHVWQAAVYSRAGTMKTGCPICAGTVSKRRLAHMQRLEEEIRASQTRQTIPYPPELARKRAI